MLLRSAEVKLSFYRFVQLLLNFFFFLVRASLEGGTFRLGVCTQRDWTDSHSLLCTLERKGKLGHVEVHTGEEKVSSVT